MQVILICAEKGGAGKTTLTRNLCVAAAKTGLHVLAVDLDPQGSLRRWWNDREAPDISMLETDPAPLQLAKCLQQANASGQVDLVREGRCARLVHQPPRSRKPAYSGHLT